MKPRGGTLPTAAKTLHLLVDLLTNPANDIEKTFA